MSFLSTVQIWQKDTKSAHLSILTYCKLTPCDQLSATALVNCTMQQVDREYTALLAQLNYPSATLNDTEHHVLKSNGAFL